MKKNSLNLLSEKTKKLADKSVFLSPCVVVKCVLRNILEAFFCLEYWQNKKKRLVLVFNTLEKKRLVNLGFTLGGSIVRSRNNSKI